MRKLRTILLYALVLLVACVLGGLFHMTQPIIKSEMLGTWGEPVSPARLRDHVITLSETLVPRDHEHPENLDAVAAYIRGHFARTGGRLVEQSYEVAGREYRNVCVLFGPETGERIVVGAHYDACGELPGADDNASGVAATLEAARVLGTGRFDRTLVVACWDEGERGQLGSKAYARNARSFEGETVLAVVFEAVGYRDDRPDTQEIPDGFERVFPDQALAMLDNEYRADFLTIVADRKSMPFAKRVVDHASHFQLDTHILRLTERIKLEMDTLHRSDHVSFWDEEMAAILLTDTGPYRNPRVRCKKGIDGPDSLDYDFAANVTRAAVGAAAEALEVR
jgi:hypothetical protein